jgi:peptidoglycan/LPS O-acetylase OafA/YrhL
MHTNPDSLYFDYDYPAWKYTWGLSFINIYAGALIVCTLVPGSVAYRIFHISPLRWIGRISYGAYVFHDIPHTSYADLTMNVGKHSSLGAMHPMLFFLTVSLTCTLLLASLSYRFFESPFLRLKERWAHS